MGRWPHCPNECGPLVNEVNGDTGEVVGLRCPDCGYTWEEDNE